MLAFLKTMCDSSLSKYPTTLDDDLLLLEQESGENQLNCIKLRIGEKEVLHEVIRFAEQSQKLFTYHPNVRFSKIGLSDFVGDSLARGALPLQAF